VRGHSSRTVDVSFLAAAEEPESAVLVIVFKGADGAAVDLTSRKMTLLGSGQKPHVSVDESLLDFKVHNSPCPFYLKR
jgi:hypothetical protein